MLSNDFNSEQRDMLLKRAEWYRKIKRRKEELGWSRGGTKFLGDVGVQVLAHYLERRLPNFKIIRGPAFVAGFEESEFDLLVVDKDATKAEFTNLYPRSKVRVIVEVKGVGLICKKSDVKTKMKNIINYSRSLNRPMLYFSFIEAKSYREEIQKALGEKWSFILAKSKGKKEAEPYENEWKRFVDCILELSEKERHPILDKE